MSTALEALLNGVFGHIAMRLNVDGIPIARVVSLFGQYVRDYTVVTEDGVHVAWIDLKTDQIAHAGLYAELEHVWLLTLLRQPV